MEAAERFERSITELQSVALATWLRRHLRKCCCWSCRTMSPSWLPISRPRIERELHNYYEVSLHNIFLNLFYIYYITFFSESQIFWSLLPAKLLIFLTCRPAQSPYTNGADYADYNRNFHPLTSLHAVNCPQSAPSIVTSIRSRSTPYFTAK